MLSSHPLKLWSHRYVCSNCSAWHWIIHLLLFLLLSLLILYCVPSFLVLLISSLSFYFPFSSPSYSCITFIFFFTFSAHSVFCCCLFFSYPALPPLFLLSLFFYFSTPHPPTHPPHSISPLLSLSLSSTVSPEASLSHHSSSFINTCTHTAQHAQLPHISVHCPHKHTYTHPRARALPTAHMSPRTEGAQCVHTLTPAYCAEKCPL